jgi:hypothetical protein
MLPAARSLPARTPGGSRGGHPPPDSPAGSGSAWMRRNRRGTRASSDACVFAETPPPRVNAGEVEPAQSSPRKASLRRLSVQTCDARRFRQAVRVPSCRSSRSSLGPGLCPVRPASRLFWKRKEVTSPRKTLVLCNGLAGRRMREPLEYPAARSMREPRSQRMPWAASLQQPVLQSFLREPLEKCGPLPGPAPRSASGGGRRRS